MPSSLFQYIFPFPFLFLFLAHANFFSRHISHPQGVSKAANTSRIKKLELVAAFVESGELKNCYFTFYCHLSFATPLFEFHVFGFEC